MPKRNVEYTVGRDHNGRTCLLVETSGDVCRYIPLDVLGFKVLEASADRFHDHYKPLPNYPVDKACRLYLNYMTVAGATDEALGYLARVIPISKEEREMARKNLGETQPKTTKKSTTKPATKTPAKQTATKKPTTKKSATKVDGEYASAAQMFKALIMAGKQTDDEIFAQVQATFGLDDNKRSYVKWYRNNLKKQGENPPEAK